MDYLMTSNIKKVCRICLKIQQHMRFLSSSELINGKFCTLTHMLKSCTSIQISLEEDLPNMICQTCINRLYISWSLKVDCENSEAKLHENINNNRNYQEREENINLANSGTIVSDNLTSKNNEEDVQVVQMISVNNPLKVIQENVGDNTKKVIVDNLNQIYKENNVSFHNNNNNNNENNNIAQNCSNHNAILKTSQNRKRCNENLKLNKLRRKVIYLKKDTPIVLFNQISNNKNVLYVDENKTSTELTNKNLIAECEDKNIVFKHENTSLETQTFRGYETIDLTLSDADNSNRSQANIEKEPKTPNNKTQNTDNKCDFCERTFKSKRGLCMHLNTHITELGENSCPICDKKFDIRSNLEMHLETHVRNNTLKCPNCSKYFASTTMLIEHNKIHNKSFDCELCCKKFLSQTSLTRHLNSAHSGVNKFFCDVCMKGFTLKTMLEQHIKIHEKDGSHNCNVCDMGFSTFDELSEHINTHASTQDTTIHCDKCDKIFTTDDFLKEHKMKEHPVDVATGLLLCKLCITEFSTKSALKQHMQIHRKTQALICKMCENVFTSTLELTNHMKSHYTCEQCTKTFLNLRLLDIHRKKHNDSLVCLNCKKHFNTTNILKNHMQTCK